MRIGPTTDPQFFPEVNEFRSWLQTHAAVATELIVGFYKLGSGRPSMAWSESVDEALCFGWIDGVRRSIDDDSYCIRFTPRKQTSIWSAVNIAKFERLVSEGKMLPAGAEAYSHRLASRSAIYAYEQNATAELAQAELRLFKRQQAAWTFFEATPPGYRKLMLHWITTAKKAETRASRLATLVAACAECRRLR